MRWLIRYLWRPFETLARRTPLWPLKTRLEEPIPGVICIRIDNAMIRALSKIAGGYDYSVCYIINGSVMIDTGFPWAARELRRILVAEGWNRSLRAVINTHYHEDHVGNNDVVKDVCAVPCLGSAITASAIRLPTSLPWYRRFLFGPLRATEIDIVPDRMVVEGMEIQFIDMPGHCPGHLSVFVPETGWLFSGDLFIAPDLDTQLPDVDGPDWVRSLEAAIALPVTTLFDAHGAIFRGPAEVRAALQEKLDFLRSIESRVRQHLPSSSSVEDLSSRVFTSHSLGERLALGDGWLSVLTGSNFSRQHLVESFARPLLQEQQTRRTRKGSPPTTDSDVLPDTKDF